MPTAGPALVVTAMDSLKAKSQTVPWKGVMALFGGFLIQLTLGSFYRWVRPSIVIGKSWPIWGNVRIFGIIVKIRLRVSKGKG